jgi:hypothetical protein
VNRKIVVGAVVVAIIAVSISLYLQTSGNKNLEPLEPSEPTVRITDFAVNNQWFPICGMVCDRRFNLTIENTGGDNVADLELKVKLFSGNSEVQVGNYFSGVYENGTIMQPLGAYEVREFRGTLMAHVGDDAYRLNFTSNETSVVAMVLLNNTVLDERLFT